MNYYISDTHFGHESCVRFDERPFDNVNEMDRCIIANWNARVLPKDDVYFLGDFAFKSNKSYEWYLRQLNGRKHLIIGNHDGALIADEKAMGYFDSVDKMMIVTDVHDGTNVQIVLCHYPIFFWNKKHHGSWHIYGHIHADYEKNKVVWQNGEDRALNAGCMLNNYMPVTFRELVDNNRRLWESF